MTDRLHVYIQGRVQGVGFRYWTVRQARALGLTGWVKNLWDGRVEAEFEGPRKSLEEMLAWCRRGPDYSQVSSVVESWDAGEGKYSDFRVVG